MTSIADILATVRQRYQPGYDLANLDISNQETDVSRNYDSAIQQLLDLANASTHTLEEKQNNFGLLSSGLTAAGLGKIQSDLGLNKAQILQDKTSKLANLAIQRAGLSQKFESDVQSAADALLHPKLTQLRLGGGRVALIDDQGNIHRVYGGTSSGGTAAKKFVAPKYSLKTNSAGGLGFFDQKGSPITAAQYLSGLSQSGGTSLSEIAQLLSRSADPNDHQIISDINSGVSLAELTRRYPYVFGGA